MRSRNDPRPSDQVQVLVQGVEEREIWLEIAEMPAR